VCSVQVTPSGEVAAVTVSRAIAQNIVPFQTTALQMPLATGTFGNVPAVHVLPLLELEVALELETAQNTDAFAAIDFQEVELVNVCAVQFMPSGEVAAAFVVCPFELSATLQKEVPFQAIEDQ
jgi:hypothetical protein